MKRLIIFTLSVICLALSMAAPVSAKERVWQLGPDVITHAALCDTISIDLPQIVVPAPSMQGQAVPKPSRSSTRTMIASLACGSAVSPTAIAGWRAGRTRHLASG